MLSDPTKEPILIVEDLDEDILLLQMALKRSGVQGQINIVRNGEEAIDYLRGAPPYDDRDKYPFPFIIYTDLKMPKVDGFGLLKWIKSHSDCSVIPIIIFTASDINSDIKKAFELGANAYLVKPTGLNELADILRKSMQFWAVSQKPESPGQCS
jgi:CheY-like chemotaxis protein